MRYLVCLSYNGNAYQGYQSQPHGQTIQDRVEKAMEQILRRHVPIVIASRTDTGVHAREQYFHFDFEKELDPYHFKGSLNALLPKDIHILNVKEVSDDFHCRYCVKDKTYEYWINNGEYDVFLDGFAFQCNYPLDIEKMKEGAALFIGRHDFSSFNTTPYADKPDQHRTIKAFVITKEKDLIKISVTGDGFLKNMVRIMVGSLLDVGRGKREVSQIKEMLEVPNKDTRRYNIAGNGLYLVKIRY